MWLCNTPPRSCEQSAGVRGQRSIIRSSADGNKSPCGSIMVVYLENKESCNDAPSLKAALQLKKKRAECKEEPT